MDNTSFAPGNNSIHNYVPPPKLESSVPKLERKHFWNHKFFFTCTLIVLFAGAGFASLWQIQNQIVSQEIAPVFTPRATEVPALNIYQNNQYGFSIALPDSWGGYTVLNSQWQGRNVATSKVTATGPIITLRHPLWTTASPREDMPMMIFTPAQWALIQGEKMAVSAAPIPPSILGQNSKYVIALPARYNYDYKTGWEEVDQLVHTLTAFEPVVK